MVSQRQQLLPLHRLALEQALEQETLHLKGALILLPSIPGSFLLCCDLHTYHEAIDMTISSLGSKVAHQQELAQPEGHSTS